MNRVVITQLGVVSPNGIGLKKFADSLKNGISGLSEIDYFNPEKFSNKIVGQVKNLNRSAIKDEFPELIRIEDNKVFLALNALLQFSDPVRLNECAINLGTSLESFFIEKIFKMSPFEFDLDKYLINNRKKGAGEPYLQVPLDYTGQLIKKKYKLSGSNYLNCSACAASTQAIGHSFHMIRDGRYKRIITGGFDSMLNPLGLGGFARLGALSSYSEPPEKSIRPFDLSRRGTILGEGAALFLLEDLETALNNNSTIMAEITGYASSLDAYKLSEPDPTGNGIVQSMKNAIDDAGITPRNIDYINAHGTGTIANDRVETKAIKQVFGDKAYQIPVSSIKSMIGHLIGASGAVEIAGVVAMIANDFISPTINLESKDPDCDLDYVPNIFRDAKIDTVLKNSMAFGGQNASIVIQRFK